MGLPTKNLSLCVKAVENIMVHIKCKFGGVLTIKSDVSIENISILIRNACYHLGQLAPCIKKLLERLYANFE